MQDSQMQNPNTKKKKKKNQSINGLRSEIAGSAAGRYQARSGITGGIVENKNESGEARDYGGCIGGRQGGVKWDSSDDGGNKGRIETRVVKKTRKQSP